MGQFPGSAQDFEHFLGCFSVHLGLLHFIASFRKQHGLYVETSFFKLIGILVQGLPGVIQCLAGLFLLSPLQPAC